MKGCKWLIAVLALVLSLGLAACGQNATQSTKAAEFVTAVEAIEEVTLTDGQAISGAYKLYDDLTDADKQKSEVVSAKTDLDSKKAHYDALVANEAATKFLTVCDKLPNADSVTREDRAIIEMAEALYESLGTAAKQVDGVAAAYAKLTAARTALDALIDTVKYIATADDFMAISEDLTGNYELTCDIDMSEKEWTVLGEFSGHLNGNGYTVKNIKYARQGSGFGIFHKVLSQGIVERLGVTGYVADAGDWAGVICVENHGTIRNCWTNVVLKSESAGGYAGLIALKNMGNGVIENCYTIGANLGMGTEYSLSKGVLLLEKEQTAQENNVFVLADNNEFTLAIGNTASSSSMMKTLAEMKQASLYSAWDTSIWNIQDGQLPALKTDSGARLTQPEVYIVNTKNSYSVSELSGSTIQVKVAAIDCDFDDLSYAIKEQGSHVTVSDAGVVTLPDAITSDLSFTVVVSLDENVSAEMTFTVSVPKNVVKISTAEQLLAIDEDLNGNYELTADIDLTGKTWTPLAAARLNPDVENDYTTKGFSGRFNGNGHTIRNFSFTPEWNGFALFNKINASAVVENVCIEATIDNAGSWIGGITVDNYGTIRNCLVKVTLKGSNNDSYAGGICCNNKTGGVIENCVVLGSIETTPSAYADVSNGAFAVENQGTITQCFALDTVTEYAVGKASGLGNLSSQTDGLKTEDEMKSVATYAEYDTDIWNIVAGEYPSLKAACGQNATQSTKATEFVTAVEAIEEVTLTDGQAISGAYKLYNDLTDADKQKSEVVSAKTNLDSKKAQYDALVANYNALVANEAATKFLTACGKLPNADSVTREDREIIEKAEALYESLGTAAKQVDGVAAAYAKLKAARTALDALTDKATEFVTAVEAIEEVTLTDGQAISDAYKLYDDLTDADKQKSEVVSAKTNLDSKKAQYDALVANEAATKFLTACGKLPNADSVTREDREIIEMAEALYESLGTAAKQVDGVAAAYAKLTAARTALDALIDTVKCIATADDFMAISEDLTGNYELTCDIDMSEKEWTVLGEFSGHLNGNGHTIKNFSFTPQWNGFALFSRINKSAVVENVCIEAKIDNAGSWIGGITVDNFGTIRNCLVNVTLEGSDPYSYAGGICCNNKTGGVIENCVVLGSIETTPSAYADVSNGAFAVANEGEITQCFALDTVTEYAVGNANVLGNLSLQTDGLKTEEEMKSVDTYAGYDPDIWNIENGQYPALRKTA